MALFSRERKALALASELMADAELEQANTSQHLAILRAQGIVESRRDGPRIMYRIKRPEVAEILALVNMALGARLQESSIMLQALSGARGNDSPPKVMTVKRNADYVRMDREAQRLLDEEEPAVITEDNFLPSLADISAVIPLWRFRWLCWPAWSPPSVPASWLPCL